jgi:hypothetical protein
LTSKAASLSRLFLYLKSLLGSLLLLGYYWTSPTAAARTGREPIAQRQQAVFRSLQRKQVDLNEADTDGVCFYIETGSMKPPVSLFLAESS